MLQPEFILGPIVGGLSHTSVNLWGRANSTGILHAWLGKKEDLSDELRVGISDPLLARDGYAGVVPVTGLEPETTYYYDLRLDDDFPLIRLGYPKFTTFPIPGKVQDFSFVFGSCFHPAKESGGLVFQNLDTRREELENNPAEKLRFILLIGDQIYSDD